MSRQAAKGPGRPPLDGGAAKVVPLSLDPQALAVLDHMKQSGAAPSRSAAARLAIMEYARRHKIG